MYGIKAVFHCSSFARAGGANKFLYFCYRCLIYKIYKGLNHECMVYVGVGNGNACMQVGSANPGVISHANSLLGN